MEKGIFLLYPIPFQVQLSWNSHFQLFLAVSFVTYFSISK